MITCHNVFNVWPKTALLLLVWPRNATSLDTAALDHTGGSAWVYQRPCQLIRWLLEFRAQPRTFSGRPEPQRAARSPQWAVHTGSRARARALVL